MKFRVLTKVMLVLGLVLALVSGASAASERVTLADYSWDSVQLHNRIVGFILEKGFGYEVDYMFAETMPGLLGVQRGDIQISMETWVDNFPEWWKEAQEEKSVVNLGSTFPDAPQGWYVPTYLIEGDAERGIEPLAPDLKSVKDLRKYWELFKDPEEPTKGRFYNGPAGWKINTVNVKKLEAYGLDDVIRAFDPGSQTALATAIVSAYEKGEPVVAYYWEPTAVMGKLDMTMLEEPPYEEEVFRKNYGCAYPSTTVLKFANPEFAENNPEVIRFLKRYHTSLAQTNKVLSYMNQERADLEEAAIWFLMQYPDLWKQWVADPDRVEKIEKALFAVR